MLTVSCMAVYLFGTAKVLQKFYMCKFFSQGKQNISKSTYVPVILYAGPEEGDGEKAGRKQGDRYSDAMLSKQTVICLTDCTNSTKSTTIVAQVKYKQYLCTATDSGCEETTLFSYPLQAPLHYSTSTSSFLIEILCKVMVFY